MKLESKKVLVPAGRQKVFSYISDLNNFNSLLPEGRITDFESTADYCSFKVQGTATIDLHKADTGAPGHMLLKSGEKSPFAFTLDIYLEDHGAETLVFQEMNADINPFLKMMVEKPLSNLFNYIVERLGVVVNT